MSDMPRVESEKRGSRWNKMHTMAVLFVLGVAVGMGGVACGGEVEATGPAERSLEISCQDELGAVECEAELDGQNVKGEKPLNVWFYGEGHSYLASWSFLLRDGYLDDKQVNEVEVNFADQACAVTSFEQRGELIEITADC